MGGDLKLSNESLAVNLLCPHDPNEATASIITGMMGINIFRIVR